MIRNYLKTAFRSIQKHKLSSFINISGLTIGICASLVIFLIVNFDFTFDRFHQNPERIYRVVTNFSTADAMSYNAGVCGALPVAIKQQTTGVETSATIFTLYQPNVSVSNLSGTDAVVFKAQDNVILADDGYFKIFSYKWLAGSAQSALSQPFKVVLSSSQAKHYFPSLTFNQMIGRSVVYDSLRTTVAGVVEDIHENTDLTFHDFISLATASTVPALNNQVSANSWYGTTPERQVFVKLSTGTSSTIVTQQLNDILKKNVPVTGANKNNLQSFYLQPLADLHFNNNYGTFGTFRVANKTILYELAAIALFLLLLGCINFVNLTTARSAQRAKEIGIRKTIGCSRQQLIVQFLSETFLITLAATILSVGLTPFALKVFTGFIPKGISAGLLFQPGAILFLIVLVVTVSVAAGFYPALILSGYKPVLVLKGQAQSLISKNQNAGLRKLLTVTQFVIAQFFIIATVLVSKQIYYALHKDLGFKKDAIVIINSPGKNRTPGRNKVLMDKLKAISQVEMVSAGRDAPSSNDPHSASAIYRDGKKEVKVNQIAEKFGDPNYIKVYGINLLAGRNLMPQDTVNTILINNALAKALGFKNASEAVGKQISGFNGNSQTQIIGVVADFHQESIHAPILPLAIFTSANQYFNGTFHVALKGRQTNGDSWKSAIAAMQSAWKQVYPDDDFEYSFFDESIARLYENERNTSKLLSWATGLSIFISCLGLLGLGVYTASQRTKEIGVRKVLGATVMQIVVLLSSELVMLVVLAFLISAPAAWWVMNKWMNGFADRTTVSWWVFVLSVAGMLLVAMLTSGFQSVKAALANPTKSLRSE